MSNQIPLSPKMKDITNLRFGSLVAKFPVGRSTKRNVLWEFQCDCGSLYVSEACWVVAQSKKATNTKAPSCGCLNKETTKELRLTHGMSTHPLFWAWTAMVERCHNPSNPNYPKYGGKGVYVCQEWKSNSEAFIKWALNNGWEKGLHLDKDVLCHRQSIPPHYSPTTCQFISSSENSRSTKKWLEKHFPFH